MLTALNRSVMSGRLEEHREPFKVARTAPTAADANLAADWNRNDMEPRLLAVADLGGEPGGQVLRSCSRVGMLGIGFPSPARSIRGRF
jgi:hypothetical protein